jgi:carbon storage regulator
MLLLTRNKGECVVINGNIKVYFIECNSKNQVKLGFEAPKDITIHREEIQRKADAGIKP